MINIESIIPQLIANASGLPIENVLKGNASLPVCKMPAKTDNYATYLMINTRAIGTDAETIGSKVENEEQYNIIWNGSRVVTFSIQFFRSGSAAIANKFTMYPYKTIGQVWLTENKIVWNSVTDIRRLDKLIGGVGFEERASIDLDIKFDLIDYGIINMIDSVTVTVNNGLLTEEFTETAE
jgi:hypothetical protein